jgi:hypothetical protein
MSDATEAEVWGGRADSLIGAMRLMSAPIRLGTLYTFAMRKGWEQKTIDGLLAYCQRQGVVQPYKAFDGKAAFRLTGAGVPAAPTRETEPDDDDDDDDKEGEEPAVAPAPRTPAPSATPLDCLTSKESTTMAKDWISAGEAAGLLGISRMSVMRAGRRGALEHRGQGVKGSPYEFTRASVVAYRGRAKRDADLLPATPARRKATAPRSRAIVPAPASPPSPEVVTGTVVEPAPSVLTEVRVLVRWVDKGWFSVEDAWAKLRELVA